MSVTVSPQEQQSLEQFYYREARLLDDRQLQQWLGLVDEGIRYVLPARTNPLVNNRERGQETMISVERELEDADSMGCPVREETYVHLMIRVERAYKVNAWAENPPARTRRIVGNVSVMDKQGNAWDVVSNFHLHFARPGSGNCLYAGQRRDRLRVDDGGFKLLERHVILDYADIEYPTLGLIF